ncbi:acyl-CoA dehydrogenase family protein [Frigidibacter sp. ROC022]|uniref:acyl-CoA dehydrogenase family protein n=1 Tax=Frigidibacter sp. ROC022 TaxID=2971796 RepID=UPI00215A7C8B|nr:acyl-CoA dehydrogenase family protein [Frigidibacter sp. ROC022]MCR8724089.1 acyl-CoA dehydrogenase family protein [Frigidibacter sp. ROC022]
MDFDLTDDRQMLSETLRRYLAESYPVPHRNAVAYEAPFHDPAQWQALADLGVIGALVPEAAGGFGGAGFDISVVFEELGRGLCPEPFLGALLAARLMLAAGEDVSELMAGTTHYALASAEIDAPYAADLIATEARAEGGGWRLTGRKSAVYGGQVAARFLVTAKAEGRLALFEVPAAAATVAGYGMIDGGGATELVLDRTPGRLMLEDASEALAAAEQAGIVALCAEAVGLMDVSHAMLLDYLRTRTQFGRPIGQFQALQHRAVDMLTEIEQARSITIAAAAALDGPDAGRMAAMAKSLIGRVARQVAEETVQMHGGIAMTWEAPVSHYAKRLVMLDAQLGDTDLHLARVMTGYAA